MRAKYRDLTLDESKQIMINLLNTFVTYCDEFNLKYSLTAGTLLGAIRHHAFIPWDDDLDVMMPREDYIYFVKHFPKWSKTKKIKLVGPKTHGFFMLFSKLIASDTVVVQNDRKAKIGVWIDIFPVDYVKKESYECYDKMIFYAKQFYYLGDHNYLVKLSDYKGLTKLLAAFKNVKRVFARFVKKHYYLHSHYSFIKHHSGSKSMCFYSPIVIKIWSEISNVSFENLSVCKFENREYKIIRNWDEYLRIHYGNYMSIPPVEERTVHQCQIKKIKI